METFFTSLKVRPKRKRRLLGKYLPPFSAKVGSRAYLIYCVDGLAGAAKYDGGSPETRRASCQAGRSARSNASTGPADRYRKAGVYLSRLVPAAGLTGRLFGDDSFERSRPPAGEPPVRLKSGV
jgi:hypothetical protein